MNEHTKTIPRPRKPVSTYEREGGESEKESKGNGQDTKGNGQDTEGSTLAFPPDTKDRPKFVVLDDWVEHGERKYRPGVYHCTTKETREGAESVDTWLCSPLYIDATTFDGQENNFGRLLRFRNSIGTWKEWSMPMDLLRGSGEELRGELLAMGVELDPYQARRILPVYLQFKTPKRRMHCALQTGWTGKSFVLPDEVIGPTAKEVIFQSGERGHDEYTKSGTLGGWKDAIAAMASGNPLLMFALSASFAAPMLKLVHVDGGGAHFVEDSSTGKTTLVIAACSIWGGPNYMRSWKATANGMEGAAAMFNDCLFGLDEISECDPREVGQISYQLGNGRGKQRASRTGRARGIVRFNCMTLSSGERTIATAMREAGYRVKAGQTVRLLDIPAKRTYGVWDKLHGMDSGAAFSDAIKLAAVRHHGHAGRAFLKQLTADDTDFLAQFERFKALPAFKAESGQDKRAATRFALIAMAGELATEYGLTGWSEGEATEAAKIVYGLWRSLRGTGNEENRQIGLQVNAFIERHGDGRFSNSQAEDRYPVRDRAGWWEDTPEGRLYLFTADGMHEALKGFDFKRGLDELQHIGALPPGSGPKGERAKFRRIDGRGMKLYPINAEKLVEDQDVA